MDTQEDAQVDTQEDAQENAANGEEDLARPIDPALIAPAPIAQDAEEDLIAQLRKESLSRKEDEALLKMVLIH